MRSEGNIPGPPDVVTEFDTQTDAEEAVQALWQTGFRRDRVGCFFRTPEGGLADLFPRDRRVTGAVLGVLIGTALGVVIGQAAAGWAVRHGGPPDWVGLDATAILCSASVVGVVGWLLGSCVRRAGVPTPAVASSTGPFVVAVATGGDRDQARAVLRRCGGREVLPANAPTRPHAGPIPNPHPG
ncbi:MAG TPA: hypothetical protein VKE74_16865 [Gemmataceae bacterium]|nr:hypothetical protein [Gemmataceae bacterium]